MDLLQVIIKPYLTEKTFSIREKHSKEVISFIVHPKASKNDIKKAFELIYQINPEGINTVTHKPVNIKTGTRVPGMTKLFKVAYITLPAGIKLAVTKEEIENAKEELKETSKKSDTKNVVDIEKESNVLEKAAKKVKSTSSKNKKTKSESDELKDSK
ncbi:MAG: 50S ribosomal protein L23 [Ureaplasma sp.]|nr:50S ribosomal protein L23 [Ureaplasma sp.]MDE7222063.1 50S ribosomal protein L23 [Ureaplasma sp.]